MDIFNVFVMIGGLALFLYGMKTMGDALSKLAGGRLEKALEHMTNRPVKAVLLGMGVTAVIQSSSATTVMMVGFVNSGIMKLSQAAGVIMGANIGTTVTSWVLSLTGIQSSNIFLRLLKPTSFSPVMAFIGIVFLMFFKNERKKDIGTILLGFAILMYGMEAMSDAVKPLAEIPQFTSLFTAFENPLLGMFAGAILTALIQSSSASVGILQAMCMTGSVPIGAALPVIMGQNIGTCITALISGIGASKNAKRASLIHLYFNLIGTILFMFVFYGLNVFLHFHFLKDTANATTIAFIHSIFNISATVVLLPASCWIEKLAYITIPKNEGEDKKAEKPILDERFLENPAFAVAQCKNAVCDMARLVEEGMNLCGYVQRKYEEEKIREIMNIEEEVDVREDELSSYLTKLSAKPLSNEDSKGVNLYGKAIVDFERISDYEKGISYAQKKIREKREQFSESALGEMEQIFEATMDAVETTVQCFVHEDLDLAFRIDPLADVISQLKDTIKKNHKKRLEEGTCSIETGMALMDVVSSLERIAKHCSNIAEEEIASQTDYYALHQYVKSLKQEDERYRKLHKMYQEKYSMG